MAKLHIERRTATRFATSAIPQGIRIYRDSRPIARRFWPLAGPWQACNSTTSTIYVTCEATAIASSCLISRHYWFEAHLASDRFHESQWYKKRLTAQVTTTCPPLKKCSSDKTLFSPATLPHTCILRRRSRAISTVEQGCLERNNHRIHSKTDRSWLCPCYCQHMTT